MAEVLYLYRHGKTIILAGHLYSCPEPLPIFLQVSLINSQEPPCELWCSHISVYFVMKEERGRCCSHLPKERTLAQNIKMLDVSWYSLPVAHNWKVCCTCPIHRTLKRTTPNGNTSSHVNSLFLIMHGNFRLSLAYPVSNISISYFNMIVIHSFTLLSIILFACTDPLLSLFQIPLQSFFSKYNLLSLYVITHLYIPKTGH